MVDFRTIKAMLENIQLVGEEFAVVADKNINITCVIKRYRKTTSDIANILRAFQHPYLKKHNTELEIAGRDIMCSSQPDDMLAS